MVTHDNGPKPAEWNPEPRPCPIPCAACKVTETPQHGVWLHGTEEHIVRAEN